MSGAERRQGEMCQSRKKFAPRQVTGGPEKHDDVRRNGLYGSARRGTRRWIGNGLRLVL